MQNLIDDLAQYWPLPIGPNSKVTHWQRQWHDAQRIIDAHTAAAKHWAATADEHRRLSIVEPLDTASELTAAVAHTAAAQRAERLLRDAQTRCRASGDAQRALERNINEALHRIEQLNKQRDPNDPFEVRHNGDTSKPPIRTANGGFYVTLSSYLADTAEHMTAARTAHATAAPEQLPAMA